MKRNRIFFTLLLALALTALFSFAAVAANESTALMESLAVQIGSQQIKIKNVNDAWYFFLPSNADLSAVTLNFSEPDDCRVFYGEKLLTDGDAVDVTAAPFDEDTARYTLTLTVRDALDNAAAVTIYVMQSQRAGAMYLTVDDPAFGMAWVHADPAHKNDAGKKANVTMHMDTFGGKTLYDGKLTSLKGRGNSTWLENKRPYQIKLDKKTDLLDSGDKANKNKTWILLANALDKTLFKNAFAFDLARSFGMTETSEYTYVDLYFDGDYRGLYMLTEKAQINSGRVDIFEQEEHNTVADESAKAQATNSLGLLYQYNPTAVCDDADITGGYLMELDSAFYQTENSWFRLIDGSTVVVKSPEFATKAQMEFISVYFNEMVYATQNDQYNGKRVEDYVDLNSLAGVYMVNEYTKNIDFLASSTYFFLPEKGNPTYDYKIYSGPAWDFDTSLGNRRERDWMRDPNGLYRYNALFYQGDAIHAAIREKAQVIDGLYATIFSETPAEKDGVYSFSWYKDQLTPARVMNFTLWPFDPITPNTTSLPTYDENYDYALNFLKTRHAFIIPVLLNPDEPDTPDVPAPQPLPQVCPYCHKIHTGFFGKLLSLFHEVLYWFQRHF